MLIKEATLFTCAKTISCRYFSWNFWYDNHACIIETLPSPWFIHREIAHSVQIDYHCYNCIITSLKNISHSVWLGPKNVIGNKLHFMLWVCLRICLWYKLFFKPQRKVYFKEICLIFSQAEYVGLSDIVMGLWWVAWLKQVVSSLG